MHKIFWTNQLSVAPRILMPGPIGWKAHLLCSRWRHDPHPKQRTPRLKLFGFEGTSNDLKQLSLSPIWKYRWRCFSNLSSAYHHCPRLLCHWRSWILSFRSGSSSRITPSSAVFMNIHDYLTSKKHSKENKWGKILPSQNEMTQIARRPIQKLDMHHAWDVIASLRFLPRKTFSLLLPDSTFLLSDRFLLLPSGRSILMFRTRPFQCIEVNRHSINSI